MPVRRRRDSAANAWLIDFWVGGKRYRPTIRAPNKRTAQAVEREVRAAIEAGLIEQRRAPTIGAAFARYWEEHGRLLASRGSEKGYLNRWADALGDETPLSAVSAEAIARAIAAWRLPPGQRLDRDRPPRDRRYVTDSTINHRLRCLQRFWARAEDLWGWRLARVAWRRLRLAEPTELPERSIPRPVLRQLLLAIRPRSRPVVMMARVTGLRRGALLRLQTTDIDWDGSVVRAVSKGRAGGKLTPVPITRAVAWTLRRNGKRGIGQLFGVSKQLLRQDWEEARSAIGRPALLLKDLRHTFAQALEDGGAGDLITDALHHSDPRLRRRYSKARIDRLRQTLDDLGTKTAQLRRKHG